MNKQSVICLDIEASGLGSRSYPIEIAWKCATGKAQDSFMINPESGRCWNDWDPQAALVHGIERERLLREGISAVDACQRLNQALAGTTAFSDALEFDYFWLRRLYEAAKMKPSFTLAGIGSLLSAEQLIAYRLTAHSQVRRHRALDDVDDLLACLRACGALC